MSTHALSRSKAHYLKAVHKLTENGVGTRVSYIAEELGVSKASSSIAIRELEKAGFVRKTEDHRVLLTAQGINASAMMAKCYDMIKEFLMTQLGVEENVAHEVSCELEHILTFDDANKITSRSTE